MAVGSRRREFLFDVADNVECLSKFYLWPLTLGELAERRIPFNEFLKNPLRFGEEEADFLISNQKQQILVASATRWLPLLP